MTLSIREHNKIHHFKSESTTRYITLNQRAQDTSL
uniref:Uncharacterized protein n=1 Tax=Anguilla anguilla TaxID=7936 RepID=A0A0E9UAD5_ANGAN